jgi:hypothetical protein
MTVSLRVLRWAVHCGYDQRNGEKKEASQSTEAKAMLTN